jgi:hypothetical protein
MLEVIDILTVGLALVYMYVYMCIESVRYIEKLNPHKYLDEDLNFEEKEYYQESEFDYDKYIEQNCMAWG